METEQNICTNLGRVRRARGSACAIYLMILKQIFARIVSVGGHRALETGFRENVVK